MVIDIFGIRLHPVDTNRFYYYTIELYIFKFYSCAAKRRLFFFSVIAKKRRKDIRLRIEDFEEKN